MRLVLLGSTLFVASLLGTTSADDKETEKVKAMRKEVLRDLFASEDKSAEVAGAYKRLFTHVGLAEGFTVVATMMVDGFETIVGEARYAFHPEDASLEFGLSIEDRWQGHGIGAALMKNLECRAASLGASRLFGDTLRSNDSMMALARKAGHVFVNHPDDWKLVRFQKPINVAPRDIPCASARIAAQAREVEARSLAV